MKRKLLSTALCAILLISCEKEGLRQDIDVNAELSTELEQLVASYEKSLDGTNDFTLKEYQEHGVKDEAVLTQESETTANSEIINYLKAKIDQDKVNGYSKTARSGYSGFMVGVFKTTTCGNDPEFIYMMDCEDGGSTNISNPRNTPFATFVNRNKNVEFHMCVVPSANFGGAALALSPIPIALMTGGPVGVVERWHDNEDHGNTNNVISSVKPDVNGYIGPTQITKNTLFSWVFDTSSNYRSLPYEYGVIAPNGGIEISIDDENGSNANWARQYEKIGTSGSTAYYGWVDCARNTWLSGMYLGANTIYKVLIK